MKSMELSNFRGMRNGLVLLFVMLAVTFFPSFVFAATATAAASFQTAYDFIYEAATGYLGRSLSIAGGIIGLGIGAATGKALPAIIGVVLAMFGALGPSIINALFGTTALI